MHRFDAALARHADSPTIRALQKKWDNIPQSRTQDLVLSMRHTLRKHAYSDIFKISPPKTESFQIKILIFVHISALNIDCGYSLEPPRRGGSTEYPQSMF